MKTSSRFYAPRGFTLLELLVVISIIAVLAGILLPVGQGVMDRARKVDAKVTMNSIITAVKAYQTEYGQYPVDTAPAAAGGDTTPKDMTYDVGVSDPSSGKGGRNGYLMDVLRGINSDTSNPTGGSATYKALNSRKVSYFESKDVKNPADPRGGFIPSVSSGGTIKSGYKQGDLVDPFGNLFCVRIDSNYTDVVMQPYPMTGSLSSSVNYSNATSDDPNNIPPSNLLLRTPVAAWSPGKDQMFGDSTQNGALTTSCDDVVSWQ